MAEHARALANAIQRAHKDCKKNKYAVDTAIILFAQRSHIVCYFSFIIERSLLMALVFYCKDILEKVTMQRNQQFSAFFVALTEGIFNETEHVVKTIYGELRKPSVKILLEQC